MRYTPKTRDQHFFDPGPKRILSLDGGGLRGALTLGILHEMEAHLRKRYGGDPDFRLAHYFDLIAGTSTGAIIAATLALGLRPKEVFDDHYRKLGAKVFKKGPWRFAARMTFGLVRPKFDRRVLAQYLRKAVGEGTCLGDGRLLTGLLMITKRLDTHSVWALGNNPRGDYFGPPDSNCDYPLWEILRASAAAPSYFEPVRLDVGDVRAKFIDGGMTPFNDPTLQALMYATLNGYRVGWPMGSDNLLVISVGTGSFKPPERWALPFEGVTVKNAFLSAQRDTQILTRTLMQWVSSSPTAACINGEIGDLADDHLAAAPLITYSRYDVELSEEGLNGVASRLPATALEGVNLKSLHRMDEPRNLNALWEVGRATAAATIQEGHFPPGFDLGVEA